MWDRVIMRVGLGFCCGDMATRTELKEVEDALGVTLPRSLGSFLKEMNGCAINLAGLEMPDSDRQTIKLVWSCDELIQQNLALRAGDTAPNRTMTFADLLWFAREPGGRLAGFQIVSGKVPESTVFVVTLDGVSEPQPAAGSLREYLVNVLDEHEKNYPARPFWLD